ncbi:MAG TPA: hypothetical protein VEL76_39770, partial [Gemmataceae bacterium]|nr:hypothetical protein [Gemmataceae bacterium]
MATKRRAVKRSGLLWRLRRHLNADPGKLAVLEQPFASYERPNLHLAVQEIMKDLPQPPEQLGVLTA